MKRLLLILFACVIGQLVLSAQDDSLALPYRLSGLISDAQTGEPVPFVSVHNGPTWNTHGDIDGVYSLNLPAGSVKLRFSALGYKDSNVEINLDGNLELNVTLEPDAIFEHYHFKRWEIDWKVFNCYGFSNTYDGAMTMFGLEGRYDIWRTPLEVGVGFSYAMPLNMKLQEAYRYWTIYASVDCKLNRHGFVIAKNWMAPYIGVAVGGGQSYYTNPQNIANFSLRAGLDVSHLRLFFEQHFNTDKVRASFFGLTYYF
ncbi:MAG: carboxypeptidase-like regulatory domain-containing protein [Bacteroidales bacterium]|nr:carboxypeptidase-like regulatory domain-containing protein [Bacteroidales bacterium]